MRLSWNSAPALAQVTTVPGPTVQAASMDQGTLETGENVRRAEEELTSVRGEVAKVVANWTNTVININKVE